MIQKAEKSDAPLLRELFEEFYQSDAVLHPIPPAFHEATLDELFSAHSTQRCYLLDDCGYALLSEKFSHEAGGRELWLEELYLRPAYRGNGLGHKFFKWLFSEARREGIARIRLEYELENTRARRLYRSLGFAPLEYGQLFWTP